MGHGKLRKFAENETFTCLLQPSSAELLKDGFFSLSDHPVKGNWCPQMFDTVHPIVLELGCGKGEYTLELARRNPSHNHVGVDIKGARLWKGAGQATAEKLRNAAFLRTKVEFIDAFFAPGEVSEIWLTFSDPQMRSENSRLSSPLFLERYRRILRPGGVIHLKTDSRFLYEYTLSVAKANSLEVLASATDLYACSPCAEFPTELFEVQTFYEKMFIGQGCKITYLAFRIDHEGPYVHPSEDDFDAKYWRAAEGPRMLFGHDSAETRRQKIK
ncbi:MAG: tRNA (guanosine(46)-N7)-methyltransferase TrmB [Bacteroidales bacterium]|nr:tRNA (guanosine(46)-N7)-methyltransferase TrmB [Bacteroidales bacterium]